MKISRFFSILSLVALLGSTLISLPAAQAQEAKPESKADKSDKTPAPKHFRMEKVGTFNGNRINYSVLAGETRLKNDKGDETASIFSTAYIKADGRDPSTRPVTFLFNGGPGSASVWLHIGIFGPRRVDIPGEATNAGGPPYTIIDNPDTILDVTDLVFIDPVGTGFSRAIGKGDEKDFLGVEEDAASIGQFIRQWLTDNKRWNSYKFMGGESYGAVRTAAVAKYLATPASWVSFNGLLIISGAVDLDALSFDPGSDSSYWSYLPSYAATAWHHGLIKDKSKGLEAFLNEVREYSLTTYAPSLLKGGRLPDAERKAVIAKLATYTGLAPDFIEQNNLRISGPRFQKELLRSQGYAIGRLDAQYKGRDYDNGGDTPDNDPSLYAISGAYTAAMNQYFADIGVDMDREYKILTGLGGKWNWVVDRSGRQTGLTVAPWIGKAMRENAGLRTFVACGYQDLATPFFAVENAFNGPGIPAERISYSYYNGGHMMYVYPDSRTKLVNDIRTFIKTGLKTN